MNVCTSSTSDACHQIRDYLQGVDEGTFMDTFRIHYAVIRELSRICEGETQISHPVISWRTLDPHE